MEITSLKGENRLSSFLVDTRGVPYDFNEGKENAVEINVETFSAPFLIWKTNKKLQVKFQGEFHDVKWSDPRVMKMLINAPDLVRFECLDKRERLIVHHITWKGLAQLVKWFVNEENVNRRDIFGWTPLHRACIGGNVETVRELLAVKGGEAALDIRDIAGNCPIDFAKKYNKNIVAFIEQYVNRD